MSPQSPIVVIDSGLGGLTVVRALRTVLPREEIVYFGDTARVPYGSKTAPTVTAFLRQIISFLLPQDPKHVVLACNTATALSLRDLRVEFNKLSISGVIEPGAKAAAVAAGELPFPVIGVIATEATVRSRAYELAIGRLRQRARLICQAAPLLAPIIEECRSPNDPLVRLALEQYLQPLIDASMDVLVLGCTHYPMLRRPIERIVGEHVEVIDSARQCAEDVARRLETAGALRKGPPACGGLRCFVTDDSPRFAEQAGRFLGFAVGRPVWVPPEKLYRLAGMAFAVSDLRYAG